MSSRVSSVSIPRHIRTYLLLLVAVVLWLPAMAQETDSLQEFLSVARMRIQVKEYAQAIPWYQQYLLKVPGDDDVRNELARAYAWSESYDSALAEYDEVLGRSPNNFDARYGKAQVLGWQHKYDDALTEIDTLLLVAPANTDVFLLSGRIRSWNNDFQNSLVMYQKALAQDSLNEEAWVGACRARWALGEEEESSQEVQEARRRLPSSSAIERLSEELVPRPKNQVYVGYEDENFDVAYRSDHRTYTGQYYRTLTAGLTLYAEVDGYRRFDQDDQSFGLGTYWTIAHGQSLYAYCLVSPNPKVASTVDFSAEYTHAVGGPFDVFLAYRVLAFTTETAHIVSPGISWRMPGGITIRPRVYVSRTVIARTTSVGYAVQLVAEELGSIRPFLYYSVGNEAYRGITLDNVESSDSWSVSVGARIQVSRGLTLTGAYQYLNRISAFRSNALTVGAGYSW